MKDDVKSYVILLFYIQHLSTKDIAVEVNISESYVTKIIKLDSRYSEEKQRRREEAKEKRRVYKRVHEKHRREAIRLDDNYSYVKTQHEKDVRLLSGIKHLNNESYRRWNYSAYHYNPSKKRYEFDSNLGRSADVPKYIKDR